MSLSLNFTIEMTKPRTCDEICQIYKGRDSRGGYWVPNGGGGWHMIRSRHLNANNIPNLYGIGKTLWNKPCFKSIVNGYIQIIYEKYG